MTPNFLVLVLCSLVPMIIGRIWYHPSVFGKKWARALGFSEEQLAERPTIGKIILSILTYLLLAMGVFIITKHQAHVLALTGPDPALLKSGIGAAFMTEYGNNFNTWTHGIPHGIGIGFFMFALPFLAARVIWERQSMTYFWVNAGYWALTLTTMACIISKWGGVMV